MNMSQIMMIAAEPFFSFFEQDRRYDVIFDLFEEFANGKNFAAQDIDNPLTQKQIDYYKRYGIKSWTDMLFNHMSSTKRNHFNAQRETDASGQTRYRFLFEAR